MHQNELPGNPPSLEPLGRSLEGCPFHSSTAQSRNTERIYDFGDQAIVSDVSNALNLFLPLKSPAQMPALLQILQEKAGDVQAALKSLHYVHYARFLPSSDGSILMVITEFDGDLESYLMDFVAVLGDIFTAILEFVQDAPRLPVQAYPRDFCDFIQQHNNAVVKAWSAYSLKTVIEIQGPRKTLLPLPPAKPVPTIDHADVQGNVLRGCRVKWARHFSLRIGDPIAARHFVAALISGDEDDSPQISTAAPWQERPSYFLNIGFTFQGLRAIGLPESTLALFPQAFREGPAVRAKSLGDTGESDPQNWKFGHPGLPSHIMLSLFADANQRPEFERRSEQLRALYSRFGISELEHHDAEAMEGDRFHFGYRDGISQPRIAGADRNMPSDLQPESSAGEFLLGKDYLNQYNGNFIGDLPNSLCDNATYAAVRVIEQKVILFEDLIQSSGTRHNMDPELIAAKMMGRWRDGSPLVTNPFKPAEDGMLTDEMLNAFDYAPSEGNPTFLNDQEGLRCPIGAHIRRLNPRSALVAGQPYSRRIIRRGLPYGPEYNGEADGIERGLFGIFMCGDLEMQFEFLQSTWANEDISTAGLRDTVDPIIGAQPSEGGKFVIRTEDGRDPIVLTIPRLVTTRGSLYLLMPGIGGLRHLASL